MSIIALFSGSFCQAEAIVQKMLEKTGYVHVPDDEIVDRASELSNVPPDKLARPFSAKTSVFNTFTGERERSIAHLRYAVAERLGDDSLVFDGFCSQQGCHSTVQCFSQVWSPFISGGDWVQQAAGFLQNGFQVTQCRDLLPCHGVNQGQVISRIWKFDHCLRALFC